MAARLHDTEPSGRGQEFSSGLAVRSDAALGGEAGASGAKPVFTLSQITTQLRTQWGGSQEGHTWTWLGTSTLTYALPDPPPAGEPESAGYVAMTAHMKAQARLAFELWDDAIAISLTESPNNPNANITFNYSSQTDGGGTYSYWYGYSAGSNFGISRAYVWLNSGWSTHNQDADMVFGGYGFTTYLHEIGHSLGLSHPGTYNAGQGSLSYANSAEYFQDTRKYTLMSYWDADDAEPSVDHYGQSGAWRYASTPLVHDIAAAQAAYGADLTTRTGNTVYGFNSNADRDVFDFTKNPNPIIAIWDAGGVDTLDGSGYATAQVIDLNPGSLSSMGYMTSNVAIAFGATIENAVGGSGNDVLSGNQASNVLAGNAGNDYLIGNSGDDVLAGGSGGDSLSGGSGADSFHYASKLDGFDDIVDFQPGVDRITFDRVGFGLSATGSLSSAGVSLFYGAAASAPGPAIILNNDLLYWDQDGNGGTAANLIARIEGIGSGIVKNAFFPTAGWEVVATGDFNNDDTTDLVWRELSSGTTASWQMTGGAISGSYLFKPMAGWDVIGVGDLNKDGTDDLVWQNATTGMTSIWVMKNGSLAQATDLFPTLGWSVIADDDLNGDGTMDLLWRNDASGLTASWLMGNGTIVGSTVFFPTAGNSVVATADFNKDGTADLLWRNDASGQVATWQMMNGAIVGSTSFGSMANADLLGTGDFNQDGTSDLIVRNTTTGEVSLRTVSNGAVVSTANLGVMADWGVAAVGDFDKDGTDDILWQNDATGLTQLWSFDEGAVVAVTDGETLNGWEPIAGGSFSHGLDSLLWQQAGSGMTVEWIAGAASLHASDFLIV